MPQAVYLDGPFRGWPSPKWRYREDRPKRPVTLVTGVEVTSGVYVCVLATTVRV